jgi:hypothetical protein
MANPFDELKDAPQSTPGNPFDAIATDVPAQSQPSQPWYSRAASAVGHAGSDLLQGVGEGALETVHGTGELIRKGGNAVHAGLGDTIVPPAGQQALDKIATPDNLTQRVGKTAEDVGEFVLGDEALKGLSLADRAMKAIGLAEKYEKATPFAKAAMEHVMNGFRAGTVTGTETAVKTGDLEKGAEAGAIGGVTGGVASAASGAAGKLATGIKGMLTDIPAATESKLVSAIGDAAENAGFERPASDVATLKDAVRDLSDKFKSRAQDVYQKLDDEAPGFQELRDKIAQESKAYKVQLNSDPTKADEIAASLNEHKSAMQDLLNDGQRAQWQQADADWSRFKALQRVQGKANAAATDLTSDELQDVNKLQSGAQSLANTTRGGHPIDLLAKAFGDDAGNIRKIVQEGANLASHSQAAKLFLKWAVPATGVVGAAAYGGHKAISKALGGE